MCVSSLKNGNLEHSRIFGRCSEEHSRVVDQECVAGSDRLSCCQLAADAMKGLETRIECLQFVDDRNLARSEAVVEHRLQVGSINNRPLSNTEFLFFSNVTGFSVSFPSF